MRRRVSSTTAAISSGAVHVSGSIPSAPAFEAGLRPGDVLLEISRQKVRNAREAVELSRKLKERALLRVWSKGGSRFIVVSTGGNALFQGEGENA